MKYMHTEITVFIKRDLTSGCFFKKLLKSRKKKLDPEESVKAPDTSFSRL